MSETIPPGTPTPSDDDPSAGQVEESSETGETSLFDRIAASPILRVSILVVALAWAAIANVWLFVFIMAIVISVFLHEMGHFLAAKRSGMKVTEYFLGFGPRIWSFRRGETEYGLKLIPAGAYVKIIGMSNLEEVAPEDEERAYRAKSFGKRFGTVLAGPAMNLALGLLLLFVVLASFGSPSDTLWQVRGITAGSAAEAAGIQSGDRLVAFDGQPVGEFSELSDLVRAHTGSTVDVTVERDGRELILPVTLGWSLTGVSAAQLGLETSDTVTAVNGVPVAGYDELVSAMAAAQGETTLTYVRDKDTATRTVTGPVDLPAGGSKGFLGVRQESVMISQSLPGAAGAAVDQFGTIVADSVRGVGKIFSPSGIANLWTLVVSARDDSNTANQAPPAASGTGSGAATTPSADSSSQDLENRPLSLLGIVNIGAQVGAEEGWSAVLMMLAVINIFLGLINLVPLLPFDGGHLAVSIYEEIRGRIAHRQYRVDMAKLMPVTYVVLLLMVGLFASTVYLDAVDPVSIK